MMWKARSDCQSLLNLYSETGLHNKEDKIKAIKLISNIFYNIVPRTTTLDVPNLQVATAILAWFSKGKPVDWREVAKSVGAFLELIELGLIEDGRKTIENKKTQDKISK